MQHTCDDVMLLMLQLGDGHIDRIVVKSLSIVKVASCLVEILEVLDVNGFTRAE